MAIDSTSLKKPCPFCGNKKLLFRDVVYDKTQWIVECSVCGMEFTVKQKFNEFTRKPMSNHDDVVRLWNGRSDECE